MGQMESPTIAKIARPFMTDEIIATVGEILRSGQIVQGKYVREFEKKIAQYIGCKHVVALNSGTAALHAAIQTVKEDQESKGAERKAAKVITTPLSFAATANAILHAGCEPVFADVDSETFNIDPNNVKESIDGETIAIEPVDVYGLPANLRELSAIASRAKIPIVEDAAEAIGATFEGRKVGSISNLTCFSTYATKNLHTGEGGFVTTDDDGYAGRLQMFRSQGQSSRYNHESLGYNFRMTEIAAAIGIPQVEVLDELNSKRRKNAVKIRSSLSKLEAIRFQKVGDANSHAWYMLAAVIDEKRAGMSRDSLVVKLKRSGIEADVSWPTPIHLQPYYKQKFGYKEGDFPNAERICKTVFQIPIQPFLSSNDVDRIIKVTAEILSR